MVKKITTILLFCLALIYSTSNSVAQDQNFSAQYKIDVYLYELESFKEFMVSKNSLKSYAAKLWTTDRNVVANDKFMKMTIFFYSHDEELNETKLDSMILKVDKIKNLVYNEDEKKFFKIKPLEFTDAGHMREVKAKDYDAYVFFDPDTPKAVKPFYLKDFDTNGGVNTVIGANSITRLISWKETPEELNYTSLFDKVPDIESLEEMSFF